MDPSLSRRTFLGGTTAAGLGFAFAGQGSLEAFARPAPRPPAPFDGYGPLIGDPLGRMALPAGFSYRVVAQSGVTATRNGPFPSDPDGMGLFRRPGGSTLVCNHEIISTERFPVPSVPDLTYDEGARGGTSTLVVDQKGGLLDSYTSVAGTDNNCAGGITPWGTWLTCEEVERRTGFVVIPASTPPPPAPPIPERKLLRDHGFVFEVDPRSRRANLGCSPIPLTFLGRFSHEAVAVDPVWHTVYLTEDAANPNGLYYRWKPPRRWRGGRGALHELEYRRGADAGRLQAMTCFDGGRHVNDLATATEVGTRYRVRWVDVRDRLAETVSIRNQFTNDEITRSRKLEGQWWGDGGAYFVSSFARTSDGSVQQHDGQVWFYDPRSKTVTLKTIFGVDADQSTITDGPDNITVSPHGGLILAEDGVGKKFLVGVSSSGTAYPLARNDMTTSVNAEFAGPTFSKDGRVLYCNIYSGFVLAITGPWRGSRATPAGLGVPPLS